MIDLKFLEKLNQAQKLIQTGKRSKALVLLNEVHRDVKKVIDAISISERIQILGYLASKYRCLGATPMESPLLETLCEIA
jgi:vesicle coat complex subunit